MCSIQAWLWALQALHSSKLITLTREQKCEGLLTCITDRIYTPKYPLYSTVDIYINDTCPLYRLLEQSLNLRFVRDVDLSSRKTSQNRAKESSILAETDLPGDACFQLLGYRLSCR